MRNIFASEDGRKPWQNIHFLCELYGLSYPYEDIDYLALKLEGEPGVKQYYDEHIRPRTPEYTRRTEKVRATQMVRLGIGAAIVLALSIILPLFFAVISLPFLYAWYRWPHVVFRRKIKEEFFHLWLPYYGQDFQLVREGGMSLAELQASDILPAHDYQHQEDFVRGTYKGVQISLCELALDKAFMEGDKRNYVNVFKGLVVKIRMHKSFSGQTVVRRDLGKMRNLAQGVFNRLERITLEDPRFENRFEVYGDNQQEARYLLTPAFMERLLHLESLVLQKRREQVQDQFILRRFLNSDANPIGRLFTARANKGIQASFNRDHLLLLIPSKYNYFEMGRLKAPISFYAEINRIHAEMQDIFGIIETLKLHEQTGL